MERPELLEKIKLNFDVHPICGLLGPRQAGKTTLALMFAEKYYKDNYYLFDLENPADVTP